MTIYGTYPQKNIRSATYPLSSDRESRPSSTRLDEFQDFEKYGHILLIHRNWPPSTTTYYSFKENKRKTKTLLGRISYVEIFQTVKFQRTRITTGACMASQGWLLHRPYQRDGRGLPTSSFRAQQRFLEEGPAIGISSGNLFSLGHQTGATQSCLRWGNVRKCTAWNSR